MYIYLYFKALANDDAFKQDQRFKTTHYLKLDIKAKFALSKIKIIKFPEMIEYLISYILTVDKIKIRMKIERNASSNFL